MRTSAKLILPLLLLGAQGSAWGQATQRVDIQQDVSVPAVILSASAMGDSSAVSSTQATVRNAGSKRILALALRWTIVTDDGQSLDNYTLIDFSGSNRGEFAPAASQDIISSSKTRLHSQSVSSVKVSVDYVELQDGTFYGPDKGGSRQKVAHARGGAWAERQRLKKIWKDQGLGALLAELER